MLLDLDADSVRLGPTLIGDHLAVITCKLASPCFHWELLPTVNCQVHTAGPKHTCESSFGLKNNSRYGYRLYWFRLDQFCSYHTWSMLLVAGNH